MNYALVCGEWRDRCCARPVPFHHVGTPESISDVPLSDYVPLSDSSFGFSTFLTMPNERTQLGPRIIGQCIYSDPPAWTFNSDASGVLVVPSRKPVVVAASILAFLMAVGTFLFCVNLQDSRWFNIVPLIFSSLFLIVVLGIGSVLVWYYASDVFKGPYLIYHHADRSLSLPRLHHTSIITSGTRLRLVTGKYVGKRTVSPGRDEAVSELQLVLPDSLASHDLVIAGGMAGSIDKASKAVASAMGLDLEIVVQDQDITFRRPMRTPIWWSR